MPFLKSNDGRTYVSLEDISIFEIGEFQYDYEDNEIAVLSVWVVGDSKPVRILLRLRHEATEIFAESLVNLIESARNGQCKLNIYNIDELVEIANARLRQKQAREVFA